MNSMNWNVAVHLCTIQCCLQVGEANSAIKASEATWRGFQSLSSCLKKRLSLRSRTSHLQSSACNEGTAAAQDNYCLQAAPSLAHGGLEELTQKLLLGPPSSPGYLAVRVVNEEYCGLLESLNVIRAISESRRLHSGPELMLLVERGL